MAHLEASFFSPALARSVPLTALVPEGDGGPYPVLYLLHGWSGDHRDWTRCARLATRVRDLPLIVAMPDGGNGFWVDHREGEPFARYLVEDVIGFVERTLPAARDPRRRAIGGLSMGGYGALRLALARPDLFASAHAHSAARGPWPGLEPGLARRVFGDDPDGGDDDVLALARRLAAGQRRVPALRIDCGSEDRSLGASRELHDGFDRLGIAHEYLEAPGAHRWDYWDARLPEALAFHARALGLSAPRGSDAPARSGSARSGA
jgi:S-formylglutathione hydrolase FrmB